MYIIARDGSGDFTSIQAAIDAIQPGEHAPTLLVVRMDEYRERVVINKDNVRIVGEARDRTVITASASANDLDDAGAPKGTFLSWTVLITGRNVTLENLTVRNDAGDGRRVGQAVALYAAGDRGAFRNVNLIAHQDTLFCGPVMDKVIREAGRPCSAERVDSVGDCPVTHGRLFFENCRIQGDVDFIFGPYRAWFEACELHMNARGGWYTAANTPDGQPWGMVFHRCHLTGDCPDGAAHLGRPWRAFARTLFLACEMDRCVSPVGFADWDEVRVVTDRLGEWGTTGARADLTQRASAAARLSDEEARAVTPAEVLSGYDGWHPDRPESAWYLCGDSTMADYPRESAPMTGWGQALQRLTGDAPVFNCAMCGRSSKSFVAEVRLNAIELCLRPGDRLVISFSHNDEKVDMPCGTSARGTFPEYLNMYIDAARRCGATPILATPIARRHFDGAGRLIPTHGDYPAALRALAQHRGVRLIELEGATMALLEAEGEARSRRLYCHVPAGHPNYPDGAADDSHLHLRGAVAIAELFMAMLRGEDVPVHIPGADAEPIAIGPDPDLSLKNLLAREDAAVGMEHPHES